MHFKSQLENYFNFISYFEWINVLLEHITKLHPILLFLKMHLLLRIETVESKPQHQTERTDVLRLFIPSRSDTATKRPTLSPFREPRIRFDSLPAPEVTSPLHTFFFFCQVRVWQTGSPIYVRRIKTEEIAVIWLIIVLILPLILRDSSSGSEGQLEITERANAWTKLYLTLLVFIVLVQTHNLHTV